MGRPSCNNGGMDSPRLTVRARVNLESTPLLNYHSHYERRSKKFPNRLTQVPQKNGYPLSASESAFSFSLDASIPQIVSLSPNDLCQVDVDLR